MTDNALPHRLDRMIRIRASRDIVFRFFTDPARWASWWGTGSTIEPRPGGRMLIRYPNGVEAAGEVESVDVPERLVFTYGYASGQPMPPGSSRVTIRLETSGEETVLRLTHEFEDASVRDHHVQGWRYQLSVFGNIVLDEVQAGAADRVDGWFAAWRETDPAACARLLSGVAVPGVRFRDRYSLIEGMDELLPHIEATHRFMPGVTLTRHGEVRRCQDTALADWTVAGADGSQQGRGTNVFTFAADGRIESVVGVWGKR
ncbi:MAG TPA: SRPBCC domain-containing protein [Vicinamibacterales bacterium]|nr:SRPBCC domain-containing protein [Vicinamibacterales bacterium]